LLLAHEGSLDPTFGTSIVITPNTGTATVMALQSDAKIVVAGLSSAVRILPSSA